MATSDVPTVTNEPESPPRSLREVLPQDHNRKETDDADGDEGAFNESG